MKELFTDQKIVIAAPIEKVWQAITDASYTSHWAPEFTNGMPFRIESDWRISSPVVWKDANKKVIVEGSVTAIEKPTLLRFTVFATNAPRAVVTDKDGITWSLQSDQGVTTLRVRQGNFASIEGGEESYKQTSRIWARVLPIIKKLAESSASASHAD